MKSFNIKPKQYMILVENKNKGFILKFMDDEEEVKIYCNQLFNLSREYPFGEMEEVINKFDCIASYVVNGNQIYTLKSITCSIAGSSDGDYSVSAIKIDINIFCLKTFIRERENHSTVFNNYDFEDENQVDKIDKIANFNPQASIIAN